MWPTAVVGQNNSGSNGNPGWQMLNWSNKVKLKGYTHAYPVDAPEHN